VSLFGQYSLFLAQKHFAYDHNIRYVMLCYVGSRFCCDKGHHFPGKNLFDVVIRIKRLAMAETQRRIRSFGFLLRNQVSVRRPYTYHKSNH